MLLLAAVDRRLSVDSGFQEKLDESAICTGIDVRHRTGGM